MRDVNLIPENCETFNGQRVLISENAHLVAQTFHNLFNESEREMLSVIGATAAAASATLMGTGGGGRVEGWSSGMGVGGWEDAAIDPVTMDMDILDNVCPDCGLPFAAGDEQTGLVLTCEACDTQHHRVCVGVQQMGQAWFCMHCKRPNGGYTY